MPNEITNGLKSEIAQVIYECGSTEHKSVKKYVKTELSEMLSKGQITKEEMKEALEYLDKDLSKGLAARNRMLYGDVLFDKKTAKLLNETGLSIDDLYQASRFAGEDYTINTVKLSKEEKSAAQNGELTRSELANIQNELNAKIKANGGDKALSEKDVIKLMKSIGLEDGTKKISVAKAILAGWFPAFNVANAITVGVSLGDRNLVSKTREEKPFGSQDSNDNSVTNETEAKMSVLKQQYENIIENEEILMPQEFEQEFEE